MADRLMRAQVSIKLDSNVPEDAIVNTFYFDQDDNGILPPPDDSYNAVVTSLADFYHAIDTELFPSNVDTTATVRIYDMRDPQPRLLRRTSTFVIEPSADDPLPHQVSLCMSFAASPLAGVNPARRRGRVYLGPIRKGAALLDSSQARVWAQVRNAVKTGAESLLVPANVGGSSLSWSLYSPTTDAAGANIDDSMHDVQSGWVDDVFDTQRRRCPDATTRTTFGVVG